MTYFRNTFPGHFFVISRSSVHHLYLFLISLFISFFVGNVIVQADKLEGTSNPKTKLQPQRRKQPAAPCSDAPSEINRTEMSDHETEGNFGSGVDLSKSDFEVISNSNFFFELFSFLNNFLFDD